ncbi:hypothetical protein MKP08_08345 [Erythrobacter sp. LQ02-29]|uniref:hypothetical protein n=1 Tax=Erythrobacter sp. LQ02-29 TaxID=2920384 RepID=UPI001F4F04F2|nr:hypothetical protein [Erythrobacter sp. LQ02-29]MCP9222753.1 hypothetical protein [Erythrobacter sp. LQ02-29]
MRRLAMILAGLMALSGCGDTAWVPEAEMQPAKALVDAEFAIMGPREFTPGWYSLGEPATGTICGTFAPGEAAREYVTERRYIYNAGGNGDILIDTIPELTVSNSPVTQQITRQTKAAFEDAWSTGCEDFRPRWKR